MRVADRVTRATPRVRSGCRSFTNHCDSLAPTEWNLIFAPPRFPSADLWGFAIRKAICHATSLQKNILFGIASRNWKPWVITHDMNVSICEEHVEDTVLMCLHVCVCDRLNLYTWLNVACLHTWHETLLFKQGLKKRHLLHWNYREILYV